MLCSWLPAPRSVARHLGPSNYDRKGGLGERPPGAAVVVGRGRHWRASGAADGRRDRPFSSRWARQGREAATALSAQLSSQAREQIATHCSSYGPVLRQATSVTKAAAGWASRCAQDSICVNLVFLGAAAKQADGNLTGFWTGSKESEPHKSATTQLDTPALPPLSKCAILHTNIS